mgnify:FL=1
MLKSIRSDALKLVTWLLCSLIIGAALAPFLYHGCKALVQFRVLESMGLPGQWLENKLDNAHFGRYFNRSMLIGALVCMYPLIRSLKLKKSHLGLQRNIHWKTDFGIGFVLASGILLIFGIIYMQLGIFEAKNSFSEKVLLKFLISALAVAVLEEFLFRGLLLGAVMRTARPFYALIFVSFFFALIHFLKPPLNCARLADQDIHYFGTGFWTVGQIFAQFDNPVFIAKGFATLFAVGLVLGWARIRTSSLWLCMGLHAGWVFCVKAYDYHSLAPKKYGQDLILPYIGSDLKEGMIPFCGVFLTGALASIWLRSRKNKGQLAQNKKLPTN